MLRKLYGIGLISCIAGSIGCSICCSPDDLNYGAYGGRWQRHDMSAGRVGSAYAEAGFDSMLHVSQEERPIEPEALPGDDNIRPVSYEADVAAYIE